MSPRNLNSLPIEELKSLFKSFDNILCDNDGVLTHFGTLLPGVQNFFNSVRNSGKLVKIVTNNTAFGKVLLSALFTKQGIECQPDDFITPTCAIIDHLKEINFKGKIWVLGFKTMIQEFKNAGIDVAETEQPRVVPLSEVKEYILTLDSDIKGIVIDLDINTTFGCLAKVVKYLNTNPDMLLLSGCIDKTLPIGNSEIIIGPNYFQQIITDITNKQILKFGKPHSRFGKYLCETLKCDPTRTLFIGDSLDFDIAFAKRMGFKQLLVLTGNTTIDELQDCPEGLGPDYYISSLEELYLLLEK